MITKLWRWLWGGCTHRWEPVNKTNVFDDRKGPGGNGHPVKSIYLLRCAHCGKMTQYEVVP